MEKVVYLVAYESGESFKTEMVEEARYVHENGANVLEVHEIDQFVWRIHLEIHIAYAW